MTEVINITKKSKSIKVSIENIIYLSHFGNEGNSMDYRLTKLIESHKKLKLYKKKK